MWPRQRAPRRQRPVGAAPCEGRLECRRTNRVVVLQNCVSAARADANTAPSKAGRSPTAVVRYLRSLEDEGAADVKLIDERRRDTPMHLAVRAGVLGSGRLRTRICTLASLRRAPRPLTRMWRMPCDAPRRRRSGYASPRCRWASAASRHARRSGQRRRAPRASSCSRQSLKRGSKLRARPLRLSSRPR